MMQKLNLKSVVFYGIAIGFVLILFKVITAYGETHLKAPPQISTKYRLMFAENLPVCEKLEPLMLNIEQSGIYVNAFLSADNSTSGKIKPTLTGKLNNQQLTLSGQTPKSTLCNVKDHTQELVTIHSSVTKQPNLSGQMTINGFSKPIKFTAIPEKVKKKSQS